MSRSGEAHQIFVAALDLEGAAQSEYVLQACGGNEILHRTVEQLLAAVSQTADFLESPALAIPESRPSPQVAADAIEGLRILRRLGAGGMATVYEAEQESPRRRVAVKILHSSLADTSAWQRFEFEADILARLHHPDIAQIYGSGDCSDPLGHQVPYFVMEYVPDAATISAYAKEKRLTLRNRLALFARVCDAVQHGHQLGVIHRDLKPGNILVDGAGRPRIIDFGVAKAAGVDAERLTISLDRGGLIGTLNYMSPEQCAGDGIVDTRSDVYSLGVVLYELMTDSRPYELSSSSILEAVRMVQSEAPLRASDRSPGVSKELNAIVMKALEKDPQRRYATASELAGDVRRFLDDRPVLARPASTAYQLRMFARRNRGLVYAVAGIFSALLAGIAATTRMAYVADAARDRAQQNQRVLEQVAGFQERQLSGVDVAKMGRQLQSALIDAVRRSLENDPSGAVPFDEVETKVSELEQLTGRANFTTLALDALQQNILQRANDAIHEQFQDQPIVRAQLLQAVGRTMNQLGRPEQSLPVLTEALRIRRQELGDDHLDTLESQHLMGALLSSLDRPDEAIEPLRDVLARYTRLLGSDHPDTLGSADSLGGALRRTGDHEQAQRIWKRTLDVRRRVLGDDHPDTLISLNNFGVILALRGDYDAAEAAWRELLERQRILLGENDPKYRSSLSNLGLLLLDQGNLTEARSLSGAVPRCAPRRTRGRSPEHAAHDGNRRAAASRAGRPRRCGTAAKRQSRESLPHARTEPSGYTACALRNGPAGLLLRSERGGST